MLQEAAELSQASFGPTILAAIGRTYLLCGEAASGHLLQGPWASLRQTGQGVKSKVHAARLALKVRVCESGCLGLDGQDCCVPYLQRWGRRRQLVWPGHAVQGVHAAWLPLDIRM